MPLFKGGSGRPVPHRVHRLPGFIGTFVARDAEIAEVAELLASARLVTLTGPSGMGKTRLAVEVVERVVPGDAFFVDLASVRDEGRVAEEIAYAFGVGELRGRSLAEVLAPELDGGALLVLDNCEHLVGACGNQVERLLSGCRNLQILATSQQRLGIRGEVVWGVPGLSLPEPAPDAGPEATVHSAAVRLFCERAKAVRRRFSPSPAQLEAIAEICRRLDGNPLAIELAAAQVAVLAPAEIAARLEDRFSVLRGAAGAGPARHQTLAAALEWSDALLEQAERAMLHRLSVFAGGFSLDAAERVCVGGQIDRHNVLSLLSALVSKSLVVADTGGTATRYRLLETVRHYAGEGLAASGEAAEVRHRHAAWCAEMVERWADTDDEEGWAENEVEQDNVRAGLEWCLCTERAELALRLAAGLMMFWESNGRFGEARDCLERVLAATPSAPGPLRAVVLHDAGFAAFMLGDFDAARAHLGQSLDLATEGGDVAAAERTQGLLTFVSTFGGGPVSVVELEQDLDKARTSGDDARLAEVLIACGHARMFRGEPVVAERHFEELVALSRGKDDRSVLATGLVGLGSAALARGDYELAEENLREGVGLVTGVAESHTSAVATGWLAELARLRGEHHRARSEFEQCLGRARTLGAPYPVAQALIGLGRVTLAGGEADVAAGLFEEAVAVAGQAGLAHVLDAALDGLGEVAVALDDGAGARDRFDAARAAAHQAGDQAGAARATYHLAELARAQGELAQAVSLHDETLRQRNQLGDRAGVADSLEALAGVAVDRDNDQLAARLFGAAQAIRDAVGCARPPLRARAYGADVARLRERMAPEELERAWAEGRALTDDEAVAYATRGRGPRERATTGLDSLTPAERDVASLAAEGLTNPEIADRLFISRRTVQSHLRRVYVKLPVSSRRQLAQAVPRQT